ncbi:MAG: PIN/TRAM domain-containing protein [Alicyclobacillaceae bacterium]|nr:PIN/TRAM domain-containing protein [Alicyclobacillaceae bacterium]
MIKRIVQLFFIVIGILLGYALVPLLFQAMGIARPPFDSPYFGAVLGGGVFLAVAGWLVNYILSLIRWVEDRFSKMPLPDMIAGIAGLVFGLIIAYLLTPTVVRIPIVGTVVQIFLSVLFGYLGFRISYAKREEIKSILPGKIGHKEKKNPVRPGEYKILDTSVIIDGRIADIVSTGFLDGVIVIPSFVLEELQHIADSSDVLKRNRGRRGLDILNRIQKESAVKVQIVDRDFEDVQEVDSKLIRLAKAMQGKVVTNDFNLNKVCELQGVPVLNINDLANAVKPVVLPGEEIVVHVIKDGKEYGQGVGYLDDGTMIVVEGGREYIGTHLDVLVTSVLQTSAGRMIFAKPKLLEKAL